MQQRNSKNGRKRTARQKKILKALIDADLNVTMVAEHYGHSTGNASVRLLREDEEYFYSAIKAIAQQRRVAS